jgi:hypothetical protein
MGVTCSPRTHAQNQNEIKFLVMRTSPERQQQSQQRLQQQQQVLGHNPQVVVTIMRDG